jgi:hypothetical protein
MSHDDSLEKSCKPSDFVGRVSHLLRTPIPPGLIERLLLVPIIVLGAERAYSYFAYAFYRLPNTTEVFLIEAKMVLLAWRAQAGLRLYPAWQDYPHVANFFGPCYFGLVGLLGAAAGANLDQLFLIGRVVSFLSGLLTSVILGLFLGRRYGPGAGVAGAVLSLGAGPMYDFSVMVRPDMMAELLGVSGFLLIGHRSQRWHWAGGALLVLAILTKQTAGVFLLAGATALFVAGQRRQAAEVLVGGLAALALLVAVMTLIQEPNFATSLLGEARTPWNYAGWILEHLTTHDPDLFIIPALGLVLWILGPAREIKMAALAVVVSIVSYVTSRKLGAGPNYFLSLRVVEALAVGSLWHVAKVRHAWQLVPWVAVAYVGTLALWPSPAHAQAEADDAYWLANLPLVRSRPQTYRAIARLARDPSVHLLTDVGLFDLYQGERAACGDPWLFRMLVQTGQIRPVKMEKWIENEYYDIIMTSHVFSPDYKDYPEGLPMPLVERARAHYALIGERDRFYFYIRRRDSPARFQSLLGTRS